jgi:hypothetical protein
MRRVWSFGVPKRPLRMVFWPKFDQKKRFDPALGPRPGRPKAPSTPRRRRSRRPPPREGCARRRPIAPPPGTVLRPDRPPARHRDLPSFREVCRISKMLGFLNRRRPSRSLGRWGWGDGTRQARDRAPGQSAPGPKRKRRPPTPVWGGEAASRWDPREGPGDMGPIAPRVFCLWDCVLV